jgi:hypothetical protein
MVIVSGQHGQALRALPHRTQVPVLSQPLPEEIEQRGGGGLVEGDHAGAGDVRVQLDAPLGSRHAQVAEPRAAAVGLAGGGDRPVGVAGRRVLADVFPEKVEQCCRTRLVEGDHAPIGDVRIQHNAALTPRHV